MKQTILAIVLLAFLTTPVFAGPIFSVDLDPSTPGIIDIMRTVSLGDTFTVNILISDDGTGTSPVIFDSVFLETSFNDMGLILDLGPTGPIAGGLAGPPYSALTFDFFGGFVPVIPGSLLTPGSSSPALGFASGSGAIGMVAFPFVVAPLTSPAVVYSIDFTALLGGTSTIFAAGSPFGFPELALGGDLIFGTLESATVTVNAPTGMIPEPSSLLLFATGGLCLAGIALRHRQNLARP